MRKSVSIIGGDLRIVNLAKIFIQEGKKVYTYGLEKAEISTQECDSIEEACENSDVIISSVPLSRDGKRVNAIYSDESIYLKDLYKYLEYKKFIAGKIDKKALENRKCEICDILEIEEYAILNAIATAEGAIQIAMEDYPKTLSGSNILILGFGRIGKILAKMLQGIGSNVYCEARKKADLAYIRAYGYNPVKLSELDNYLGKADIIVNNIPTLILDKSKLDLVKKDILIIDLASNPGGVDFEYAKEKNIKVNWALGLPGKVAPISAAEYIKSVIESII